MVTTATSGRTPAPAASRVWKLDSSKTQACACPCSSSSSGMPMLPASAVRNPAARSRCATSALVVLLPLVPVTQMVRASGLAANHSAVPPTKRVPHACACSSSGW